MPASFRNGPLLSAKTSQTVQIIKRHASVTVTFTLIGLRFFTAITWFYCWFSFQGLTGNSTRCTSQVSIWHLQILSPTGKNVKIHDIIRREFKVYILDTNITLLNPVYSFYFSTICCGLYSPIIRRKSQVCIKKVYWSTDLMMAK